MSSDELEEQEAAHHHHIKDLIDEIMENEDELDSSEISSTTQSSGEADTNKTVSG